MAQPKAHVTSFDLNGDVVATSEIFLPEYLDWLPIEAKVYWFLERGLGKPEAEGILLVSQGQQKLAPVTSPLRDMKLVELKEKEHGLEQRVQDYIDRQGLSRTPRNQ